MSTNETQPQAGKNLYQRIIAVMQEVGYVKKSTTVSAGTSGSYMAVSHDAVAAKLRAQMIKNGIAMHVSLVASDDTVGQTKSGAPKYRYSATYDVSFINIENPDDRQTWRMEAHAEDGGDKAPGKALSYAVKMVLLKAFMLETGESDESRYQPDDPILITTDQAIEISDLIDETNTDRAKFMRWCSAETVEGILAKDYQRAIAALRQRQQQQEGVANATPV